MNATMTQPTGTIEHVDPALVVLEDNIRVITPDDLDAGFVESIRQNGVIQPVVGWRDSAGVVQVRYGQRRTVGARVAGVATIPVYVTNIEHANAAQRIVEQLVENEQRANLTEGERVQAWKQLELAGLSVTAIAKRTGTKRDTIKTGMSVAGNETASAALQTYELTLDQAAVLIEFEGDEKAVTELIRTATTNPGQFAHEAQRARDAKIRAALKAEAVESLTAKGYVILDRKPGYWEKTPVDVSELIDARTGEDVTGELIAGLEGASVHVGAYGREVEISYFIEDPKAHGFKKRPRNGGTGKLSEEERAERRVVRTNNAEWDSAEVVRREWLATFLGRKTLPKNAAQVIATALTADAGAVSAAMGKGNSMAAKMLGLKGETSWYSNPFSDYLAAHPTRAGHVTLAVILGGIEASTGRHTWRNPDARAARYFAALAAWGYDLAPVEKIAAGIPDTEANSEG